MVKLGMTPMQAIVATTKTAAECSRIGKLTGTLEPGKRADLRCADNLSYAAKGVWLRAAPPRPCNRDQGSVNAQKIRRSFM